MKDKDKIALVNYILNYIKDKSEQGEELLKYIGTLNKAQGMVGFHKSEIGSPVFEKGDRYILVLQTLDNKNSVNIPYYKEDLGKVIDFI